MNSITYSIENKTLQVLVFEPVTKNKSEMKK